MNRPRYFLLVALAALRSPALAQLSFEFTFAGPAAVEGEPGEQVRFEARARIVTRGAMSDDHGAEAWSMAIAAEGCAVRSGSADGTAAEGADFFEFTCSRDGSRATLAVVLDLAGAPPRFLRPSESPHDVLVLELAAEIPAGAPCTTASLRYLDGVQIPAAASSCRAMPPPGDPEPVANVVASSQEPFAPVLDAATISLRPSLAALCTREPIAALSESPTVLPATLASCSRRACFRFTALAGSPVLLDLKGLDGRSANALYLRWGEPASPERFDLAADARNQPDQRLVVPAARSGTAHVTVLSNVLHGDPVAVELTAVLKTLEVERISPRLGAQGSEVRAVILGGGFRSGVTEFVLVNPTGGDPIAARESTVIASSRAEVVFAFAGHELGSYHLDALGAVVGGKRLSARLMSAFSVVTAAEAHGLALAVSGQRRYGFDRLSRATLAYENIGDEEMTAPLFRITGPPGTSVRLDREEESGENDVLVLGINPEGFAEKLPRGVGYELPIVFQSTSCANCALAIEVHLLTPNRSAFIGWDQLPAPAGLKAEEWSQLWPGLSRLLGSTWGELQESLARIATRLNRRGVEGASVRQLLAFAVRQARGFPSAAALGTVRDAESGAPLAGALVVALEDSQPRSSTTTDGEGTFALECLENGRSYRVEVAEHTGGVGVTMPPEGDLADLEFTVEEGGRGLPLPADSCPSSAGAEALPFPPTELFASAPFTKIADWSTRLVSAIDPNEKDGTEGVPGPKQDRLPAGEADPLELGVTDLGFVGSDTDIIYTVFFENEARAEVPAKRVEIEDQLETSLDWTTLRFLEVRFGDQLLPLDSLGRDRFSGYHLADGSNRFGASASRQVSFPWGKRQGECCLLVDVTAGADLASGRLSWRLQTLDPSTVPPREPDDVDAGFLPPDVGESGQGEGSVSFAIRAHPNLAEGAAICNNASITFDRQHPISTNAVRNRFSRFLPAAAARHAVPAVSDEPAVEIDAELMWDAAADAYFYDLYLWEDSQGDCTGRPDARPTASRLPTNGYSPPQVLKYSARYCWQVVAKNLDPEDQGAAGEVWHFVTVPEPPPCPEAPRGLAALTADCLCAEPLLCWEPAPRALRYAVCLSGAEEDIVASGISGTRFKVPRRLRAGEYRWKVIALNARCPTVDEGTPSAEEGFAICTAFLRGDATADGAVDISDSIRVLGYRFLGDPAPPCEKAADADDNGALEITDAIYLLGHLFLGRRAPPAPFPECGLDSMDDALSCETPAPCLCSSGCQRGA